MYALSLTLSPCTSGFDAAKHCSLRKCAIVLFVTVYGSPSSPTL